MNLMINNNTLHDDDDELHRAIQLSLSLHNTQKTEEDDFDMAIKLTFEEDEVTTTDESDDNEQQHCENFVKNEKLGDMFDPVYFTRLEINALFLGEGDFSFVRSLVESRDTVCRITATTDMDYHDACKYPKFESNLFFLMERGVDIQMRVDARRVKGSVKRNFHYAFWNFPCDSQGNDNEGIPRHNKLLRDTIVEASKYLFLHGQIRITLKNSSPYTQWLKGLLEDVEGEECKMAYIGTIVFDPKNYKNYHHVTTFSKVRPKDIMNSSATHVWVKIEE